MSDWLRTVQTRGRVILVVLFVLVCAGVFGVIRPLPEGVNVSGEVYTVPDTSVRFLVDETFVNEQGEREMRHEIFDEVFGMIDRAESFILVDMFLWNAFQGDVPETHRALADELTLALITKKQAMPDIKIVVISDPINTVYFGQRSSQFDALEANGIPIVVTDLSKLRDSNPTYSALWRTVFQWIDRAHVALLGSHYTFRWLPNIMDADGEPVTLRAYLSLFNFKANHRKLLVADEASDEGQRMVTLVTSANPHNGSSAHSNVALRVAGGVWREAIGSELAVARFSGRDDIVSPDVSKVVDVTGDVSVALVTEDAIRQKVVSMLRAAGEGDAVELAMFYLSEASIIEALIEASKRGASVRIILDPNKDAFGREKNGIPNRQVAAQLVRESDGTVELKWCATHGEQCHTKMLLVATDTSHELLLGSANFTRRNLRNYNLETNVWVASEAPSTAFTDARAYFTRMWENEGGLYTHGYDVYRDESRMRRVIAWFMERTGLSTF